MHSMFWEQNCYEIINYESKLLQIQVPLSHVSHGFHWFSFLEIYVYADKSTLVIFDIQLYLKQYLILLLTNLLLNIFLFFLKNH